MQIVIDIPEEMYEVYHKAPPKLGDRGLDSIVQAIANGTPLPKGHGRLVDADSMKTMKNIQSANFNAVELIRLWIDKQDTVVEADKNEEI